jgi:hypothetical protein
LSITIGTVQMLVEPMRFASGAAVSSRSRTSAGAVVKLSGLRRRTTRVPATLEPKKIQDHTSSLINNTGWRWCFWSDATGEGRYSTRTATRISRMFRTG